MIPVLCCISACDSDSDNNTGFAWPANTAEAVNQYATIVDASYADSYSTANALNDSLNVLVTSPS